MMLLLHQVDFKRTESGSAGLRVQVARDRQPPHPGQGRIPMVVQIVCVPLAMGGFQKPGGAHAIAQHGRDPPPERPVDSCTVPGLPQAGGAGREARAAGRRALARLPPEMGDRRKDLSLEDVAAAGSWKDVTTLLTCYQHADEATILRVMESPVKFMSRRVAGAVEKR
jgi:hypothetical protein